MAIYAMSDIYGMYGPLMRRIKQLDLDTFKSGNKDMHDIFFDGENHFFIDGIDSYPNSTKDDDRVIPLLVYEEYDGYEVYYSLLENSEKKLLRLNTPKGAGKDIQSGYQKLWDFKN